MKKTVAWVVLVGSLFLFSAACPIVAGQTASPSSTVSWPTKGWPKGTPASVGLDENALKSFDADIASGKYGLTDSFRVFRCGTEVFARQYQHDYGQIYAKEAKTKGPLNARLTGRYNYYDPEWHPFYHGTDLHTMQSVTKTVTSIIFGVAITRGDFKASLNTPVLKYFDAAKVKNVDDWKRHMTIENLLTMTSGLNSEELYYTEPSDAPEDDVVHLEAADDWVQYAIDEPVAEEPGKNFTYSSADAELLAYVFQKETGQDIEAYAEKYLFAPLGIRHYWKRDYAGNVDTEGGLYLNDEDLAKLGFLYLNNGVWEGKQIVSEDWVKQSVAPQVPMAYTVEAGRMYYGFTWWLYPVTGEYSWQAVGLGGQFLFAFPRQNLIAVFTGWDVNGGDGTLLVPHVLSALKAAACTATVKDPPNGQLSSSEQQASKQGTKNPEAYALYLKGRSYWAKQTRADLETAVSYFNQAIAKDPGYAMAFAGLADCYAVLPDYGASVEDIPKAKAAALKALELDPTLARAHVNLGGIKMAHEWDFAGGEAEFKKAFELDPNDAHAHQRYADNLGVLGGREQEALAEINRAHQLDPLSPSINADVGNIYIYARRFDDAIAVCKKVADENPTFALAHSCLANAYWAKHMYPQVIEEQKVYGQLTGDREDSEYASAMELGFHSGGWQGALNKGVEVLQVQRKTGNSSAYTIATMYAELGDKEKVFSWLNTAFQERDELLMGLKTDFALDSIRSEPRFAELVRKVGLPQ
jgi:CubicO group peptidase (beta-lactamase class C family)